MHRSYNQLIGLGLIALGCGTWCCGSPGDLNEAGFPPPGQTGYPEDQVGSGGNPTGVAGSGGAPAGVSGSGGGSTLPVGGSGGSVPSGGTGSGSGGSAGGSSAGGSSAGGSSAGGASVGGCPDDISVLLNRPGPEGGCQGSGCHVPGGQPPDLTSPGVAARLLNVMSTCNNRPYISASDSFLENKLVGNPPDCGGYQMPFFTPAALNAADKQCIIDWIDEVANGT